MDESLNGKFEGRGTDGVTFDLRQGFSAALAWSRANSGSLLCSALLLVMASQMLFVISRKSITNDETVLIPAAYYHLVRDDIQLIREHPPLCKLLAGIPLLLIQPNEISASQLLPTTHRGEIEWAYCMHFWEDNTTVFRNISFWARVPMIALTMALGVLIFIFTRELFGSRAALFAVLLFSLEPTTLAHGRVVQTDIPAAFGYLLVCFALYRYLKRPYWKSAVALGAASGLALLAKFSMLIVAPVLLIIFLVLLWRNRERRPLILHAVFAVISSWLVVCAAYFFNFRKLVDADAEWVAFAFPASTQTVMTSVRILSHLLPADFVLGVFWQIWHSQQGHSAGLLGMYSDKGWWYYFPVAFALKATIPFLLLSISALTWAGYSLIKKRELRYAIVFGAFALYTLFVLGSTIDIGVRYYLPAFMFLFMLGGDLLNRLLQLKRRRVLQIAVVVFALAWCGVEAVRAFPNHMTYMNQMASRQPHWWYLSDSNVEWGDDIGPLADYLKARGERQVRAMLLGGFITLKFYGVDYLEADVTPASACKYTALGASFLNGSTVPGRNGPDGRPISNEERVNTFDDYRHRKPEIVIGNSIYVYRNE